MLPRLEEILDKGLSSITSIVIVFMNDDSGLIRGPEEINQTKNTKLTFLDTYRRCSGHVKAVHSSVH